MQTYYPSLDAIQQQTMQLTSEQCKHCGHADQLVSHGFIRKKQPGGGKPQSVGKRVFCSNRNLRTGCGRTMQLYLDSTLRYMHYAGSTVVAFVLLLLTNVSITLAYTQATHAQTPRHAYRWLQRLHAKMSVYRSLVHQPPLDPPTDPSVPPQSSRHSLLDSTFSALLRQFAQPLCQSFQSQLQHQFF
jgi:transposase-like protein